MIDDSDKGSGPLNTMSGYRQKAIFGALVTGGGTLAKGFLQVMAIVVLARLLSPEDFGLLAMVFPIIAFATIFQEAGLGLAVLQRDAISDPELSTVFWCNAAVGTLLGALLVAAAPYIADFYDEPRLVALTTASSAMMILGALSSQHIALLMRQMAFGRLALMDTLSLAVGTSLAIVTAHLYATYWAILLLNLGTTATMCVLAWVFSGWRPGPPAPLKQVYDVLRFGMNVTLSDLATYFGHNTDKILIGKFSGTQALGFYERAYKVVLLPILFVHMPMFRLVVPMLSQSRQDHDRYRHIFIVAFQLSLLITVPGTLLLIVAASPIVLLVMGDQWLAAVPIFAWLAMATLGQLATGPLSMIFISQGRSRELMICSLASSVFATLAFVVGLPWGAAGVAAAYAASELIRTPLMLWYATRTGPVGMRDTVQALVPFCLAALLGSGLIYLIIGALPSSFNALLLITICAAAVYMMAAACLLVNRRGRLLLQEIFSSAVGLLNHRRNARPSTSPED